MHVPSEQVPPFYKDIATVREPTSNVHYSTIM